MKVTNINYTDTLCTLSADEQRVAQMLGDAWNQYLLLPIEHPCERDEFCRAIHACQRTYWPAQQFVGWRKKAKGIKNDNRK